jgi:hypothetical protein
MWTAMPWSSLRIAIKKKIFNKKWTFPAPEFKGAYF